MSGLIIKIISNTFTVLTDKGIIDCKARGKLRNLKITPIVGDNVIIDYNKKYIIDVLKRKNFLERPTIANIDQALIIVSVKEPNLDLYLLDKLLCIIEFNNIKPIICFTKLDLLDDVSKIMQLKEYYSNIGYQVFTSLEKEELKKVFKNKISVFTGQSGAGKSTLLNALNDNFNLKTDEISLALGRGKHTTRHVELLPLFNGMCADTPGFSSLSLKEMSNSDIRDNMIEFNEYKEFCEYKDCMHDLESNCEIKRQINNKILKSRYNNYLKFIKKEG
ncbi:MAG: ribosome small subunit-dependent GTPase A [Bacilli bacterium]